MIAGKGRTRSRGEGRSCSWPMAMTAANPAWRGLGGMGAEGEARGPPRRAQPVPGAGRHRRLTPPGRALWERFLSRENLAVALRRVEQNAGAAGHRRDERPTSCGRGLIATGRRSGRARRGHLPTATRAQGEDPQALGRGAGAGGADGAGSVDPAGPLAGAHARSSTRGFSERSFGFRPGRSAHQAVERARATSPRARRGPCRWISTVLRSSPARRADGAGRKAGLRQAGAQADPPLPGSGRDGGRRQAADRGGDPAGLAARPLLSNVIARRPRPGAGAARAPLRPLRGRHHDLRPLEASGRESVMEGITRVRRAAPQAARQPPASRRSTGRRSGPCWGSASFAATERSRCGWTRRPASGPRIACAGSPRAAGASRWSGGSARSTASPRMDGLLRVGRHARGRSRTSTSGCAAGCGRSAGRSGSAPNTRRRNLRALGIPEPTRPTSGLARARATGASPAPLLSSAPCPTPTGAELGLQGFSDPYRRFRDATRTARCGPARRVVWEGPG